MSATLKELKGSQIVLPVAPPQAYPTVWFALKRPLCPFNHVIATRPLASNILVKMKRGLLLDVVVRQRALILQAEFLSR